MAKLFLKIPTTGKIYQINWDGELPPETQVLVEAEEIIEPAIIIANPPEAETGEVKILRQLTEDDWEKMALLRGEARAFIGQCQERVNLYGLAMKIIDAELSFDEKKLTFYFSAEGRVDFRELTMDLVRIWHKLIRLQQINPREQARLIGGYGRCGQELCCSRLGKAAQSQEVVAPDGVKDVSRHLGACGRLMCCLNFEK